MRNNKRLDLGDLKRRLKAQVAAEKHKPRPLSALDDGLLLSEALRGVKPIAAPNLGELHKSMPQPVVRHRDAAETVEPPSPKQGEDWLPVSWFDDSAADIAVLPSEESALAHSLRGATPLLTDRVFPEAAKPLPVPRQHLLDEQAALAESIYAPTSLELRLEGGDELHYLCNGVPRSVLKDLRRGRWVIQEEIDLHGATRDEARDMLAAFMGVCRKNGTRCVRVVHGKGRGSPGREPVLKRLVAGWLMNYDDVIAYCQARLPDGGAGALIVLLKAQRPVQRRAP